MSDTPKFTPGPWKRDYSAITAVKTDADGDPVVIAVPFGTNKRNNVRGLDVYSVPPQPEADANARLIAAAPDLYAALKSLTDECAASPDGVPQWSKRWDAAYAALAKAVRS